MKMTGYKDDNKSSDRAIFRIILFFFLLFFMMLAWMLYFIVWRAPELMGSPYNARMEVFDSRIKRGSIISSDGQPLAATYINDEGEEERVYLLGESLAHVVGYSQKGKTGLEQRANFYLMSSDISPVEKLFNELSERKSPGNNVFTSLDAGLSELAYSLLKGRSGAIICMEVGTGRILAMVSAPSFNPNTISEDWSALVSSENSSGNLLNRATQGLYPPGSIFKTVMLLEYMREHPDDYNSFHYNCNGSFSDPEHTGAAIHCYNGAAHKDVSLGEAYALSCNTAFAHIGTKLDIAKLSGLCDSLYFNREIPGSLPAAQSSFSLKEDSELWELMQSSIGQGSTLMTPLHCLLLTEAIANNGVLSEPVLIDRVEAPDGAVVRRPGKGEGVRLMTEEEAATLKELMALVVSEGTGSRLRSDEYSVAGKTGSAEYLENGKKRTNAWFTGFAPIENPEMAISIIVEDGESGGKTAAPIARELFDYRLLGRE